MSQSMLLVNPRRRRKASPARRRRASTGRRRNPIAALTLSRRRRRNPIAAVGRRSRRRRNPIGLRRVMRRRRNPLSLGGMSFYTTLLKDAVIGGVGSVGMDYLMAQLNPILPVSLQPAAANISANDAVRAFLTAFLGKSLSGPTKGMSIAAARGALTVQVAAIINTMAPAAMSGFGYASPARIIQGTNRVGPIRKGMNAYLAPGTTPLLNAYLPSGRSPLLSGVRGRTAQQREGVSTYY